MSKISDLKMSSSLCVFILLITLQGTEAFAPSGLNSNQRIIDNKTTFAARGIVGKSTISWPLQMSPNMDEPGRRHRRRKRDIFKRDL